MIAAGSKFLDLISYQISLKLAIILSTLVTKSELHQALLDMSNEKALGLDNVIMEFFKKK